MRRFALLPLLALFLLLAPRALAGQDERGIGVAQAEDQTRVALVIGNSRYPSSPLRNPANDARAMTETLREMGFRVHHHTDQTNEGMKRAIQEFGDALRRADVGLFYYAGHGIQANGRNYLIPVDAEIRNQPEVEYESVDLGRVIAQMEAAAVPLNIVILDACRNNPFARSFRSASRGLTQVTAPTGTLIAYATAPGRVASDGDGENGLYTQELLRYMRMPGLDVEDVFKQVRISLIQKTNGDQTPWESSSLVGEFAFVPEPEPAPEPAPAQRDEPAPEPAPVTAPGQPAPDRSERPPAPGPSRLLAALDACVGTLADGDVADFDRRYTTEAPPGPRAAVRSWIESAPGRSAERGAELPGGVRLSADGLTARMGTRATLFWRHAFGGRKSAEVSVEATLAYRYGGWEPETCRVIGSVGELR
jgi:hypothetical protein